MSDCVAIAAMIAALETASADCAPGSECQRLLEKCLQTVRSLDTGEIMGPAERAARARTAAQMLRDASRQNGCQIRPSMEDARRSMTSMLFAILPPR
jgi:hypothetical protein